MCKINELIRIKKGILNQERIEEQRILMKSK